MPTPSQVAPVSTAATDAVRAPEPREIDPEIQGAARQFEAMLLSQLMSGMRRTVPQGMMGNGLDQRIWHQMLDQALSSNMAEAGGIGLADVLAEQLSGAPTTGGSGMNAIRSLRATRAYGPTYSVGVRAPGALGRLQQSAVDMLAPERAHVWGRQGRLGPEDLTNEHVTASASGVEGFNVLDANGYEDYYKCNLFAFEMAYRAGLRVPVVGRGRGWGYPGPHGVVQQIERGHMDGRWAVVADGATEGQLAAARAEGVGFMLVGEGRDGRQGHMGVVDEIHRVVRDDAGHITRVEYSGWEANGDAAHHRRRTWGTGRFASIHLLELRAPAPGEPQVVPMGARPAGPSRLDAARFAPDSSRDDDTATAARSGGETVAAVRGRDLSAGARGR